MKAKLGNPVSFIPTPVVRRHLEELVATGLWGRRPGTCVERIVERFIFANCRVQLTVKGRRYARKLKGGG